MSPTAGQYVKQNLEAVKQACVQKEKNDLLGLYEYLKSNKEGLLLYKERCLKLPEPLEGLEYRNLGTMEHHVCDGAAKRMKHQKASQSKDGAPNLGRILCLKVCENLYEAVTSLSKAILPERYAEDIEELLSAAKAPKKDGNGYQYPVRGGRPFVGVFMTNGRKAILGLLGNRGFCGLDYRQTKLRPFYAAKAGLYSEMAAWQAKRPGSTQAKGRLDNAQKHTITGRVFGELL